MTRPSSRHVGWAPLAFLLALTVASSSCRGGCGGGRDLSSVRVMDLGSIKTDHRVLRAVALSPDGTLVAAASDDLLFVWELATGKSVLQAKGMFSGTVFAPDGRTLYASSQDLSVHAWAVGSWAESRPITTGAMLFGIAVSPDGGMLATVDSSYEVALWDAHTWERRAARRWPSLVSGVRFGSHGGTLEVGAAATKPEDPGDIWDLTTGETSRTPAGAFITPDGAYLQVGADTLRDRATGREVTFAVGEGLGNLTVLPGARVAVSTTNGKVRVLDLAMGQMKTSIDARQPFQSEPGDVLVTPDGKLLVVGWGKGAVEVFALRAGLATPPPKVASKASPVPPPVAPVIGHLLQTFDVGDADDVNNGFMAAVFAGDLLAAGTKHGALVVIDPSKSRTLVNIHAHGLGVDDIVSSHDGRFVATAGSDGDAPNFEQHLKVWAMPQGTLLRDIPLGSSSNAIAISRDGTYVASRKVWSVATGEVVGDLLAIAKATGTRAADPSLLHGHGCRNFDCLLAYAHTSDAAAWRSYIGWGEAKVFPDANALVQTAPAPSHDVLVSSLTSGDGGGPRTMAGARDAIVTLALSPDGRTVAASQEDGEILVWDAPSGTQIASFLVGALNGRDFLSFAPDGKRLAWCSGGAAGRINVWLVR